MMMVPLMVWPMKNDDHLPRQALDRRNENRSRTSGVSCHPAGTDCYAEFGMTGADSTATNWRTCRFPEAAKVCDFEIGDGVGRGGVGE
jgi:hypothetical protein